MKNESKRLFISDLPNGLLEEDLNSKFGVYGNVTSIEIKQRKDLSTKNSTDRFAYINVDIDRVSLEKCFEDFSRKKWNGHYINVQLAKESFLERLKREREEANRSQSNTNGDVQNIPETKASVSEKDEHKPKKKAPVPQKDDSSSESSSDSEDEKEIRKVTNNVAKKTSVAKEESSSESSSDSEEEREAERKKKEELSKLYEDVVIKNNKNKRLTKSIESFGKEPVVKIEKKKPKSKDPSRMQADQRRLKSMQEMRKGYDKQKSAIKMALAKVDEVKFNKIKFDEDDANEAKEEIPPSGKRKISNGDVHEEITNKKSKLSLFEEESDAEEDNDGDQINFEVKKQFEGKKGQKLMELQSKFKRDQRFQMDERFLEDEDEEDMEENGNKEYSEEVHESTGDIDDKVTQQEKQKQMEILEQVLGKTITKLPTSTTDSNSNKVRKTMLRFNPEEPDHSKYEVQEEKKEKPEKKKKKKKDAEVEEQKEELPEVSKETFYEVKDAFKPINKSSNEGGFSLLSMFGRANVEEKEDKEGSDDEGSDDEHTRKDSAELSTENKKKMKPINTENPFKYDSSDDEGIEKEVKANKTEKQTSKVEEKKGLPEPPAVTQRVNLGGRKLWTEPFFFKDDDYRFQEGIDFIKKLEHKEDTEFVKLRRDLKMIVRDKFMHNQRKNRMFKKKLGGGNGKFKKFKSNKNKKTQKK